MADLEVKIEPVALHHKDVWRILYGGYARFYGVELTDGVAGTVWGWLHDVDHVLEGVIAFAGVRPVGLAHYRPAPNPLRGADVCFLDDLFVVPEDRAKGAGRALITHVRGIARRRGWRTVRWITAADNHGAKGLYDQMADGRTWDFYEMSV